MSVSEWMTSLDQWVDSISHPYGRKVIPGFPWATMAIEVLYLTFVLKVGPAMMKNRPAFDLKWPMRVYNVVNIVACAALFLIGLVVTGGTRDAWRCTDSRDISPQWAVRFVPLGYTYLKVFDLLDTVFFILRKKFNQVTTLHVIHHSIMPLTTIYSYKFCQNSFGSNIIILNSFIHVVMYTYYFLSSFGPEMQPYLWWKKHLTKLQLVQFVILLAQSSYFVFFLDCPGANIVPYLQMAEAGYFLFAFGQFYIREYSKERKTKHN
ncbi:Elongation of very long chain fatty acids protein 7 [Halotydeus destructor]|nr:Elongation of very long chain fatty acids protein 7 [Halotydeus destructor]